MRLFHQNVSHSQNASNSKWCRPNKVFFPIQYDLRLIKFWKKQRVRIFQRLDGVYYPSHFPEEYLSLNNPIKTIYSEYSDFIIFQSEYSQKQCREVLGFSEADSSIIYNGVDKDVFYVNKNKQIDDCIDLVMTGNFRDVDMIYPLVRAMEVLESSSLSFRLRLVGPVLEKYKDALSRQDIELLGAMDSKSISQVLRDSDIFVYSFLNPNCPNSVIEAISTGLPVVGFDSGSMSELCSFQTELLAGVSDKVIQLYEELDGELLAKKILLCAGDYNKYREVALANSYRYDIKDTVRSYLTVLNER